MCDLELLSPLSGHLLIDPEHVIGVHTSFVSWLVGGLVGSGSNIAETAAGGSLVTGGVAGGRSRFHLSDIIIFTQTDTAHAFLPPRGRQAGPAHVAQRLSQLAQEI